MAVKEADIWVKAVTSKSRYWGYGLAITILEPANYKDEKHRYFCLTDHQFDCKHVLAVKTYLQGEPPVLGE